MKALITGATGFVGANLVEAVTQRGWQARALHRKTSSLKALQGLMYESALGDITEPASLLPAMRGVDVVFHAAAVADYWRAGRRGRHQAVRRCAAGGGVVRARSVGDEAARGADGYGREVTCC